MRFARCAALSALLHASSCAAISWPWSGAPSAGEAVDTKEAAACTAEQRKAVESVTADGAAHLRLIEECKFSKSCIGKRASGRLRELLAHSSSQQAEDLHTYFNFFDAPNESSSSDGALARGHGVGEMPRGGLYVELGALDGAYLSNTIFYQQALGWGGVLIEAALQNFLLLERNVASGVRRNVTAVHAAACPSPTVLQLPLPANFYNKSHSPLDARRNRAASGRATDTTATTQLYTAKNGKSTTPLPLASVLCVPMATLLEAAPLTKHARGIELYSIDVEGHELNVVSTHDWRRLPAKVVIVEMNRRTTAPALQAQIRAVLRGKAGMCYYGMTGHANEVWVDPLYERKVA